MERIEITLVNGNKFVWDETQFTDYIYDGKCFIIKQNDKWVGLYPVDALLSFVYFEK